jgi:hypothetical protein
MPVPLASIDALMRRTRKRPIPAGPMLKEDALGFGLVLAVLSVMTLGIVANWPAAAARVYVIRTGPRWIAARCSCLDFRSSFFSCFWRKLPASGRSPFRLQTWQGESMKTKR